MRAPNSQYTRAFNRDCFVASGNNTDCNNHPAIFRGEIQKKRRENDINRRQTYGLRAEGPEPKIRRN